MADSGVDWGVRVACRPVHEWPACLPPFLFTILPPPQVASAYRQYSRRTASNTIAIMPRTASSRKKASAAAAAAAAEPEEEYSDNEETEMMFTQQMPEMSQALPEPKDREKQNLESLDPHVREKLLTTLSRLLLFKALAGETIDKVSEGMEISIKRERWNAIWRGREFKCNEQWANERNIHHCSTMACIPL